MASTRLSVGIPVLSYEVKRSSLSRNVTECYACDNLSWSVRVGYPHTDRQQLSL